jgi:hypothetical protein
MRALLHATMLGVLLGLPSTASAQSKKDLQRQIDELRAELRAVKAAQSAVPAAPAAPAIAAGTPAPGLAGGTPGTAPARIADAAAAPHHQPVSITGAKPAKKAWFERLQLRGYTQMRFNGLLNGDDTAPAGRSRLRSVHDAALADKDNFSLRRARLILQGQVADRVAIYLQTDFASAVNAQSNGERREHYGQLRDAYVDIFLDKAHEFKLRAGQSKVPFGWENMQSSSNRLTLDRSDGINSGVPSERDLGIVAYYTPTRVQKLWDRLAHDGQKTFGNYGAFAVAAYNGQGVNRSEQNANVMKVVMATWPFELDGLGDAFAGQVVEVGGAGMLGRVRPEIRTGGVSPTSFEDNRVAVHAMLYPQPFGIQAEWSWGRGPQYDIAARAIRTRPLGGGYVQAMLNAGDLGFGKLIPYGRWQRYRGGWKGSTNAPRLETDEIELGVEWHFLDALELTVAYANMKRREADERRTGRAKGNLIRTQLQWSY